MDNGRQVYQYNQSLLRSWPFRNKAFIFVTQVSSQGQQNMMASRNLFHSGSVRNKGNALNSLIYSIGNALVRDILLIYTNDTCGNNSCELYIKVILYSFTKVEKYVANFINLCTFLWYSFWFFFDFWLMFFKNFCGNNSVAGPKVDWIRLTCGLILNSILHEFTFCCNNVFLVFFIHFCSSQ